MTGESAALAVSATALMLLLPMTLTAGSAYWSFWRVPKRLTLEMVRTPAGIDSLVDLARVLPQQRTPNPSRKECQSVEPAWFWRIWMQGHRAFVCPNGQFASLRLLVVNEGTRNLSGLLSTWDNRHAHPAIAKWPRQISPQKSASLHDETIRDKGMPPPRGQTPRI